MKFPDK